MSMLFDNDNDSVDLILSCSWSSVCFGFSQKLVFRYKWNSHSMKMRIVAKYDKFFLSFVALRYNNIIWKKIERCHLSRFFRNYSSVLLLNLDHRCLFFSKLITFCIFYKKNNWYWIKSIFNKNNFILYYRNLLYFISENKRHIVIVRERFLPQ